MVSYPYTIKQLTSITEPLILSYKQEYEKKGKILTDLQIDILIADALKGQDIRDKFLQNLETLINNPL